MSVSKDPNQSRLEVAADVADGIGFGFRVLEIGVFIFIALLVTPPLMILAVVVVVPTIAVSAVVAAVVGAIAAPVWLARRVHAYHLAHGSMVVLHRVTPSPFRGSRH